MEPVGSLLLHDHNQVCQEADANAVLRELFQEEMLFSNEARIICERHKEPTKEPELVGCHQDLDVSFLKASINQDILNAADQGSVAHFVKARKVIDPNHPACIEANLFTDPRSKKRASGTTLFVSEDVAKGRVLGTVVGTIIMAHEADDIIASANDGKSRFREAHFFDLEGCLEEYGGWVSGDSRLETYRNMLILDTSKKRNLLSFVYDVRDIRDDPKTCPTPTNGFRRTPNIKWVQIRSKNMPRIIALTTRDIKKGDELISDIGSTNSESLYNIYRSADNLHSLQKLVNDQANNYKRLEEEYGPSIAKGDKDNKDVTRTRNTAVHMIDEWEQSINDDSQSANVSPEENEGGTVSNVGRIISTHLIGSLRREPYEDAYDDEDIVAELLSEHQTLIYNETFLPKKTEERKGISIYV